MGAVAAAGLEPRTTASATTVSPGSLDGSAYGTCCHGWVGVDIVHILVNTRYFIGHYLLLCCMLMGPFLHVSSLLLQASVPSIHVCSASPVLPQLLNQAPPGAQQLRFPDISMVPHLGHVESMFATVVAGPADTNQSRRHVSQHQPSFSLGEHATTVI